MMPVSCPHFGDCHLRHATMTRQFFHQALSILLFIALLIACVGRYTDIDLLVADWMYRTADHVFPWKDSWFAAVFMHRWIKYFLIVAGLAVLGILSVDFYRSFHWLHHDTRKRLTVVALSFITVPAVISLMKSQSIHHCPWDLQRYGGYAPYLRLFDSLPDGFKAGHCFPAGHASSGLWLASFAVFWLPKYPRMVLPMFAAGLALGFILGWVQQMRGAHFLTHTLWSAWIASLLILILARLILPQHIDEQCTGAPMHKNGESRG